MLVCRSIQKIRDKQGKIIGHKLQDMNGQTADVKSLEIKRAILNKQIEVVNLTLTADGRLIDRDTQPKEDKGRLENIVLRAKAIGLPIKELDDYGSLEFETVNNQVIVIIDRATEAPTFTGYRGKRLKVIGGSNLKSTENMFYMCLAEEIDLDELDTSKVTNMTSMFQYCKVEKIKLSKLKTHNVTTMINMFRGSHTKELNLSSFNTSRVESMYHMFWDCSTEVINLASFDTRNVSSMVEMFNGCTARIIAN